MKNIKEKVLEIVKIAQECPDNLQKSCFEILLKHELGFHEASKKSPKEQQQKTRQEKNKSGEEPKSVVEQSANTQDDLTSADLHLKTRRFLEKQGLSVDHLNQLFYKDGDQILPLYDDLKTTRTSESQIRITLLQCLLNSIRTGDFQTQVESARDEASTRKCYDKNNWGGNYSNNAALFDFEKYSRQVKVITLSEQGKAELANVIKELQ